MVFLGQCFLLGEELTPLLVNMKGVVEQVSKNKFICMIYLSLLCCLNNITLCC